MIKASFGFLCSLLFIAALGLSPVRAEGVINQDTLPLEIALIYHKLINSSPNFEEMAKYSPQYINSPEIGKDLILTKQANFIENLYQTIDEETPIFVIDNFIIDEIKDDSSVADKNTPSEDPDDENVLFRLPEMSIKLHYIYDFAGKTYIVFIRNAENFQILEDTPTYVQNNFLSLARRKYKVGAELRLKPVAADVKPYIKDGEPMRLILADFVLVRFIDNRNNQVLWEKIDYTENTQQSPLDLFFEKELESIKAQKEGW